MNAKSSSHNISVEIRMIHVGNKIQSFGKDNRHETQLLENCYFLFFKFDNFFYLNGSGTLFFIKLWPEYEKVLDHIIHGVGNKVNLLVFLSKIKFR